MRLVTYDRRGHRRLGAIHRGEVVDLPDLVGHPAFPATMEALVTSRRGSVLDAARAALERDEAEAFVVARARLLAPLLPSSFRSDDAVEGARRVLGPDDEVPWPAGAGWLDYEPKIVAVLGTPGINLRPDDAAELVFGYTLVNDWAARDVTGDPTRVADGVPLSLGPCIVPAEEVDPQTMYVSVRVEGEDRAKGNLNGAAASIGRVIARASFDEGGLLAGDAFASDPFLEVGRRRHERQIWPGALVEVEAEGVGILRNRVASRG